MKLFTCIMLASISFLGCIAEEKGAYKVIKKEVLGGDGDTVAGDPDKAREALVASFDRCFKRAAGRHRGVPLVGIDEVVQLEEVDVLHPEAFERVADLVARLLVRALDE